MPLQKYSSITMAHGGGGRLMHDLIEQMFQPAFQKTIRKPNSHPSHDSAILNPTPGPLAFTSDSYVVRPIFFPGGDIGSMAIHGTLNDLAMAGAKPRWISVSFILEESFPMENLWKVVNSMTEAACKAQVEIVTGDTKVVERGRGDGIFINTTGVGEISHNLSINPNQIQVGDAIILSGDIGRHGVAVMASRENLEFETTIHSDSASVVDPVLDLVRNGINIHCLRDCTRGGLISTLNELAQAAHYNFQVEEPSIPVLPEVRGACEMLGLDPMSVANEGRFVAIVPPGQKALALEILQTHSVSKEARIIGHVNPHGHAPLTIQNAFGTLRIAAMLSGEQLPRIC